MQSYFGDDFPNGLGQGEGVRVGLGVCVGLGVGVGLGVLVGTGVGGIAVGGIGVAVGTTAGVSTTISTSTVSPKVFPDASANRQEPMYVPARAGAVSSTDTSTLWLTSTV